MTENLEIASEVKKPRDRQSPTDQQRAKKTTREHLKFDLAQCLEFEQIAIDRNQSGIIQCE